MKFCETREAWERKTTSTKELDVNNNHNHIPPLLFVTLQHLCVGRALILSPFYLSFFLHHAAQSRARFGSFAYVLLVVARVRVVVVVVVFLSSVNGCVWNFYSYSYYCTNNYNYSLRLVVVAVAARPSRGHRESPSLCHFGMWHDGT